MASIPRALVSGALVLSALLGLAGCRSGAPPPLRIALVTFDGPASDALLNASARSGLAAVRSAFGAEVVNASATSRAEFVADLTLFADEDYDEVFGSGPALATAMTEVARRYPRRNFVLLGATSPEPNVTSVEFPVEQAAFLAGALAATAARGRDIDLDVASGAPPEQAALRSGFIAGVREIGHARPVRLDAVVAKGPLAPAATLYDAGSAVAFAAFRAPRRGAVLARAIERADVAVLQISADARSQKVPAGRTSFGIAEHGVELGLTARGRRLAGQAGLARLARLSAAIADGRIVVPRTLAQLAAFKALPAE
jgi:basic membrane lipoprotein Med (substrate-binding protein (PBP1-ABC) superfamily)